MSELNAVMTASEVVELCGLSEAAVRKAISDGRLAEGTYRKSGGTWLILRSEVERVWNEKMMAHQGYEMKRAMVMPEPIGEYEYDTTPVPGFAWFAPDGREVTKRQALLEISTGVEAAAQTIQDESRRKAVDLAKAERETIRAGNEWESLWNRLTGSTYFVPERKNVYERVMPPADDTEFVEFYASKVTGRPEIGGRWVGATIALAKINGKAVWRVSIPKDNTVMYYSRWAEQIGLQVDEWEFHISRDFDLF